jgi:hypothetical protein
MTASAFFSMNSRRGSTCIAHQCGEDLVSRHGVLDAHLHAAVASAD